MKLKDLFQSTKVQKSSSLQEIAQEVESQEYIQSFLEDKTRFLPNVDYSDPANFAFFGSAEKYYTDAFNRIRNTYPYDGSEKEKYDWLNDSAFIDLYIFDQRYPRYNGHVKMSYPSWGTLSGSIIDGYGKSDTDTYIKTFGGPNKSNLSTLEKQFGDANVYDSDKSRESNLKFKLEAGVSIEMWIKKEAFNTSKTQKEVLFDLWNGQASSSAQYGRLRLELTGASSGSPFLITAMSGASGSQNYSIGQNITTASIEDWTHIAVTLKNSGSDILTNLYINGELNKQESITGAALGEVTGSLISYIGALQTAPSGSPTIQSGAGKFSGSLDEFRYWKAERTSKQIGRYYWTNVGGGTNTDDANTDLGIYYKFNEGITQTSSYDSVILDYSGRLSNGTWTGYSSGARSTDSAIVLANASPTEFKDPTIYSSHPSYVAVLAELEASGNVHDTQNNSAIFHTLPGWIIEDDDTKEGNLKNLTQIIGSYFDNTFLLIQELSSLKDIYSHFQTNTLDEYSNTSTTGSVKPLPFADRLLTNAGFVAPELFADATVLESLATRSEDENYELKLHDVKNQIYQNVYSSLTNTFKEKGTNKSFRNILHSFGIDEDVVKINFYGDNVDFEIKDRHNVRATKSKFVDFNGTDRFAASVYQYASGSDSVSFISGTSADFEKYIPVTFEVQTILGDKLPWDEPYGFQTGFTKSVIAGIHEADPSDGSDYTIPVSDSSNLQIYTVRDELESKRVRFHLSSSGLGIHLSSSLYDEMYENNDWLLAFRIRNEKYPTTDFVISSSLNSDYIVDFVGYNTLDSTEIHSFHVSASVGSSSAHSFLNTSKRIYVGAKRENFTGSLEERSDHKIGFVRYWMNYLSNDVLKRHSYDSTNYGVESPFRSAYLMEDAVNNIKVPEIDTLLLAWDFETLSTSDSNGEFTVLDVTSGSGEQRYSATFESLKRKFYHGKGEFFLANDEKAIDVNYINAARSTYPEILQGEDMVEINSTDDIKFTKNTLPQDYFIAFEKSMYQTISEEMIRFMSSVTDFNDLIGRPVDRYRMDYKDLSKLRQLFFERIGNEPDLDKYIDYYKWLDDALGQMLVELVPASLKHSDGINNVIENHVFSRDKYHNKFPTIEFKTPDLEGGMNTINRHLYPWKTGHAPVGGTPENENCYWWLERAERDAGILSSSDSGVNNTRTRVFQARNSVLNRSYTTPQRLDVSSNKHLHGGINYEPSKKRDYVWSATKEVAESPNYYGQMPMSYSYAGTPLRYILANNDMFQALKDCNDDTPVPTKIKRAFSAIDGFQVFHHYSSGGAPDGVYKGGMVMPFNIMSSSALKGYSEAIEGLPGAGEAINVVNVHSDTTDNTNEIPMQSPFTERWVGGHQHRHVALNTGIDAGGNRPEGYKILVNNIENTSGSIGVAGADYPYPYASQYDPPFFRSDQAKARYYRDERAKRPLNVKNIQTTGSILGNYQKNYQFVHTFGRGIQKPILRDQADGFQLHNDTNKELPTTTQEASLVARGIGNGNLASNYNTSSLYLRDVKTSTANTAEFSGTTESIIASRFSAPGGFETMSEVFLDLYGKEKSAYNALPFRNLQVRGSGSGESGTIRLVDIHGNRYGLITHLTRHAAQFGIDSVLAGTNPAFHKTNRNPKWDTSEQSYDYDNYWIQHQIPQSDYQYQWVKLSHTASLATSSLAGHILSEYTAPTGATSYYPHESVNYAVPSQSVTNRRRSTLSVYGYPSWEQVRNNDRNVNNQLKKQYGYTIATSSNVQAETDRLSLVGGIERDLRTVRTIEKKGNVTLEEPRVVANVPYTLEMNLEGTEFEFTYPYVNARYHFNNTEFYNQEVNPEFNETMYESFFGYYSSEDDEAFTVVRKNVKQIVYPQFIKHTKHSVRHRHFFASHYWADGENDLYNTDINETGSYHRLDEVGRREVNVTASLFGTADLNSQTKRNIDQGYMTNVIPSQSIWSMDSRTNFTSSNPQTAASNSAGAPGVLQNQDHHFHNGLASVQVLVQSGSAATGSFELSGSTIFGSGSSGSFNVLGLPGQSGSYASGSFEVTGANIQGTSATGRFTVTGTYNPPTTSSFGFSVGSRTVLGTESSGSFTMTGSTVFGSTSSGSFQMTGSTVFGIASTGSFQMTGSTIFGAVATGSFDVTASFTSGTAGSGSFLVSDYASAQSGDSITIDGQTITLTVGAPPEGSNEIQLNNVSPPDDTGFWDALEAKIEGLTNYSASYSSSPPNAYFALTSSATGSQQNPGIIESGVTFSSVNNYSGSDAGGAVDGESITISGSTFTINLTGGLGTGSTTDFHNALSKSIKDDTDFDTITITDLGNGYHRFKLTASTETTAQNIAFTVSAPSVTTFVNLSGADGGVDAGGAVSGAILNLNGTTFTIVHDLTPGTRQINASGVTAQEMWGALTASIVANTVYDTITIDSGVLPAYFALTSSVTGTTSNGLIGSSNDDPLEPTFTAFQNFAGGTYESGASSGSTLTIGSTTFTIVHDASPSALEINASGVTSQQMWNAMTAAIISETVFDTISVNSSSNPAIFSITSSTTGTANNVAMSETGDTFSSLSSPAGGTNESGASSGSTLTIGSTTFTIVHDASPSALEINASGVTNQQMWNAMSAAIISNTDFDTISVNSASSPAVFSITSSTTGTANNVAMTEAGDVFVVTQAPTGGTDETGVVDGDSITWFAQPADNAYKYILVIDSDDSNTNGQNYSSSVDASGTTTIYVDSTRNGNSEFWNAMSSAISASGFTVSKTNDSPVVGSASFEITNSVGGATGNNGTITISGNSFSSSYSNLIGGADSTGAESGDTVTIDGITFTLTHTATSSVTEVQASGVSDSVFWESLRTKIESNTGYTATTGSDDPRTFQLTSSATGSSENPNISETGTAFTIQSAGADGTDESGAEDADSITIDGVAFDIDIASGLGTGSTSQFHNALSKSIKDNTDFDTITISDLGNGYHRFSLTSSVTGTAKNVAFTRTLGGARSTFQNLTGASGGTTAPAGVIGGDYLILDPGVSGTINDTRHIRIGPPFYSIGDATTRIDVNTSSISAGNDLARSTEFWNLLTQSIKNSSSFDTVSLNVLSAYSATISITSSVTGTYFNGAFDSYTSGFSPIGNTAGGTLEAGAKSGDSITISGTTITIVHATNAAATEVNASGVTNQQFWNDLSAAIIANTDFDTISISTSSFQATFNLTSSVTGTSHNVTLTTSSNNRTFSGVEGLSGGSEPVYQSVKFTEVIPQPRYSYPHTLTSPGSLRSPSEKSNLGLINTDYKLRSNHFNITRSLGHVTDGLFDNTARWDTPDLSGLTPFDSDYNAWYENVGAHNKHYSLVPEFRISSHVENILNSGTDEFDYFKTNYWLELTGTSFDNGETISTNASPNQNQFLGEYSVTTNIKNIDKIVDDNSTVEVHPVQITLTCDSILKFLPYEGFYPQTRTVQMCQAFANSYGKHFTAVESDSSNTDLEFPDNNVLAQSRPIYDAIMSPGILYNTIKSGIAVDYPILTNKMLTASIQDPYGGTNHMIKNEYFNDRLPFETLITPETYLTKKGIVDTNPHPSSSFNLKTSWTGEGDLNYKLMANNFFAETIEFFLEGGKTSRIISKPDTDPTFGIVAENELGELPVYRAMFRVYKSKKQHPYLEFTGSKDIISASTTAFDRYHDRPPSGSNYFLKDYAGLTGTNLEYDINKVSFPRPQLNPYSEVGSITMYSQPNAFGPPCAGGVATEFAGLSGGTVLTGDNNNTTYMMYDSTNGYNSPFTPPYYDGESWAIYTFKPKRSGKHTLDEILESTTVKYLRYELNHESGSYGDRGTFGPQGFSINDNAMQANASFNLFKQVSTVPATFDNVGGVSTVDSDPNKQGKAWVIESKFETPILDFSKYLNREYNATFEAGVTAADIYTGSLSLSGTRYESGTLGEVHPSLASVHYLSGILNPVGMWHQYGEFPEQDDKGIFMQIMDIPTDYTELGTELTIANPKYATVKPIEQTCDSSGLQEVYNTSSQTSIVPYFKKQEIRRRLAGSSEFSVDGGAIQVINAADGTIIDTELKESDLESVFGTLPAAGTGSTIGTFTAFEIFRNYDVSELTGVNFASGYYNVYSSGSSVSESYSKTTGGNYPGHWQASYYHYDRPTTYKPILIKTKNFESLKYDFNDFKRGFYEEFLKDFSIGMHYAKQATDFSDNPDIKCAQAPQNTVFVPSNIKDIVDANNNNLTITSLSELDSSDKARSELLGIRKREDTVAKSTFKAVSMATTLPYKFKLIPPNPAVATSPNTSSYDYSEPMFVRGSIKFNQGAPIASSDIASRGLSHFASMSQHAPQSDANIGTNPSTVRWGQFMHNQQSPQEVKSLADLVGFSQEKIKMGVTAKTRMIKEAIIAIPYIEEEGVRNFLNLNKTAVNDYLFAEGIILKDRNQSNPNNIQGASGAQPRQALDTAVESQIQKMQDYSLPPHLDFIENDIDPVAMYIFEFTKELSRNELNDLWQGVRSETLKNVSFEQKTITHSLISDSLLSSLSSDATGNRYVDSDKIKNLKWMVFKVKQKANKDYFEKMEKDLKDNRFNFDQENSKQEKLKYGYNWPYDYFSLVENAKMTVDVEFLKIPKTQVIEAGDLGNQSETLNDAIITSDYGGLIGDLSADPISETQTEAVQQESKTEEKYSGPVLKID